MSEQEKQEQQQQQGQPTPQRNDMQQDKSPASAENPAEGTQPGAPESKIRGCFDDIVTGEGTGSRAGEYN